MSRSLGCSHSTSPFHTSPSSPAFALPLSIPRILHSPTSPPLCGITIFIFAFASQLLSPSTFPRSDPTRGAKAASELQLSVYFGWFVCF